MLPNVIDALDRRFQFSSGRLGTPFAVEVLPEIAAFVKFLGTDPLLHELCMELERETRRRGTGRLPEANWPFGAPCPPLYYDGLEPRGDA